MIGGGSYDEGNQGLKIDQWIDIGHIFQSAQVTYSGEYKQGNKIGRWDSWWKSKYKQNLKIGGGYYDKGGQSDKIGLWVDVSDEFFEESQVIFNGEYKNGKKIGRWGIWLRIQDRLGGNIGRKQIDVFYEWRQLTYNGDYNNGKKVGFWDTRYRKGFCNSFKSVGGGLYDEAGHGLKYGYWIDTIDYFGYNYGEPLITLNGQYYYGTKVGIWNTWYKQDEQNEKISEGCYDKGMKIGQWIEICDEFRKCQQITLNGEYNNGKKVGVWMEMQRDKDKTEEGFKTVKEIQYDK
ncbi:unnamed protein product [Paramecium octaurelia]|uniref:MORN repeat protein n=1 Tax=Paramecium octaurelia TaxID=43137 RepID=A0A8S1UVH4_PAROT|nr:unnamed protein product [Paramecium octaurelia]